MRLIVVYRSYGGENMKNRPGYYSKLTALLSMLRAAETAHPEIYFLNDGPVPEDRSRVMREHGTIVELPGVGMRRSYVAALRLPFRLGLDDDDFVWFGEDDYLYAPEAFERLRAAAGAAGTDYLALFAGTEEFPVNPDAPRAWTPRGWRRSEIRAVDDHRWVRALSTTSSFGVRFGALREDYSIFLQGLLPHKTMLRDHDTCVVYQGHEPHSWRRLGLDLVGLSGGTVRQRAREAVLVPFKAALNLRSHRRTGRRRTLLAAAPNLATHLEIEWMAPGRDWQRIAEDTKAWAGTRSTER